MDAAVMACQSYRCRDCGRQFVEHPQWRPISEEMKGIIDRLLLEKISLAGIARVLQISELWVQQYVNQKSKNVPQEVQVRPKKSMLHMRFPHVSIALTLPKHRLTVQMDELWSFVDDKGNEQWVWLAMDVVTREIVGCYIGDRSGTSAQALWNSLPAVYRQCAVIYSDFWVSYPVALRPQAASCSWQGNGFNELPNRASTAR